MSLPTLMLLDGESGATLGIVHGPGSKGVLIMVGSNDPPGRSRFSRYGQRSFSYSATNGGLAAVYTIIIQRIRAWCPDIPMPPLAAGWRASAPRKSLPHPVLLKPRKRDAGMGIRNGKNAEQLAKALAQSQGVPLIHQRVEGEDPEAPAEIAVDKSSPIL